MTVDARLHTLLNRLSLPPQDLPQLTFCEGCKEAQVRTWVKALPMTQINVISTLLYKAVPEIARLKTSPATRLAMLEMLRLPIQQCIQGLTRHFLNQPLILPDTARKTATIAQALQKHLSNGYLVVVRELCQQQAPVAVDADHQARQALAIHRALTGLGLLLLRNYQLYIPVARQLWTELHTLYLVAETLGVGEFAVEDSLPHQSGIKNSRQAYIRVILLACASPSQLRQDEVLSTYNALEKLSEQVQLLPHVPDQKENLFVVMLGSNRPPLYKSHLKTEHSEDLRELNTTALVKSLQDQARHFADNADAGNLRNAFGLSSALTDHLIQSWNIRAQRSFDRQEVEGTIEVTIGLSNLHFYLSGQQPFNVFLNQLTNVSEDVQQAGIFQQRGIQLKTEKPKVEDPWGEAFDVSGTALAGKHLPTLIIESRIREQEQEEYQGQHPTYQVPMVDVSPGGYCLEWQEQIPVQLKAGELVGLREQDRSKWTIGVVRWVHQTKNSTQMGIQLLGPGAMPLGIALLHKTGGYSEYLRALQLPALKAINQPATLLTNAVSFREYSKVRIFQPDSAANNQPAETTAQLTRRIFSTGAFSQFTFRELANVTPDNHSDNSSNSGDDTPDFGIAWE